MIKKSTNQLQFVHTSAPMATVEIDVDSIPSDHFGYGVLVDRALTGVAERWPALRATVCVYEGPSINFGADSQSAFFGVAGDKRILAAIYAVFSSVRAVKVCYSDSILASQAICQYHLEDERVCRPLEEGIWYAGERDDEEGEQAVDVGRPGATTVANRSQARPIRKRGFSRPPGGRDSPARAIGTKYSTSSDTSIFLPIRSFARDPNFPS